MNLKVIYLVAGAIFFSCLFYELLVPSALTKVTQVTSFGTGDSLPSALD